MLPVVSRSTSSLPRPRLPEPRATATSAVIDNDDIKDDIASLAGSGKPAIPWGWYQEGFKDDGSGTYPAYVAHHNAAQYFGYVRQNAALWNNVHDLTEVLPAITKGTLPDRGSTLGDDVTGVVFLGVRRLDLEPVASAASLKQPIT